MNLNLLATTSIEFPNLHISLNNLPKSFSLFGVDIAFYGVIIAFGMLAGIAVSTTRVNEFLSAMNKTHVPKKVMMPSHQVRIIICI